MNLIEMLLSGLLVGLSYVREGKGKDKQLISREHAVTDRAREKGE
jgi:hypothetical protein